MDVGAVSSNEGALIQAYRTMMEKVINGPSGTGLDLDVTSSEGLEEGNCVVELLQGTPFLCGLRYL